MFKLLGNKRLFILLFAFIFFIAVMGFSLTGREQITWMEKWVTDSVAWTQSLINRPVAAVAGFFEDVRNLRRIYAENEALKQALALYARDVAKLNFLEMENERLKEALAFTERQKLYNQYRYRIAHVTSFSTDPLNNTIRIDLGSRDGIREDLAVMTKDGLIGRVVRVAPFYSTVELLTNMDPVNRDAKGIAATVLDKENDSFGIIESYDRENGVLVMTKIRHEDPLAAGDIVITSGLGDLFPPGLVIGTVVNRQTEKFGTITHSAEIKPAANLDPLSLREVFVVEPRL